MEKTKADAIITEYLPKIYGFAIGKAFFYDEAEEISAGIVEEVYRTLLKSGQIFNLDGYIRRICEFCYAKYVAAKKKQGISLDAMFETGFEPSYEECFPSDEASEEILILRREIAFLTKTRREVVYSFYFDGRTVAQISRRMGIPEGTVKWHLNKARNDLKRGFTMERKIGKLGLNPIKASSYSHNGNPGSEGGPEYYLRDKLNLNLVYSVYHAPKTKEEIAEELGITPVFLEDRIAFLEDNGFLTRLSGDRFTTYVCFRPLTYSRERSDKLLEKKLEAAELLAREYVPKVREAISAGIADPDLYIPSGNRELFESAVILLAVGTRCGLHVSDGIDLSKYRIKTTRGGDYIAYCEPDCETIDPEYTPRHKWNYSVCGVMNRISDKYPVSSISSDSRYCSRKEYWQNNRVEDYEYLYEYMIGAISDRPADADKMSRLRERRFIDENGKIMVMVMKAEEAFWKSIPALDEAICRQFADTAMEYAVASAADYPEQMRDLIITNEANGFIGFAVGLMVKDILYANGTFRSLTEEEKITSDLIVFTDRLPE